MAQDRSSKGRSLFLLFSHEKILESFLCIYVLDAGLSAACIVIMAGLSNQVPDHCPAFTSVLPHQAFCQRHWMARLSVIERAGRLIALEHGFCREVVLLRDERKICRQHDDILFTAQECYSQRALLSELIIRIEDFLCVVSGGEDRACPRFF